LSGVVYYKKCKQCHAETASVKRNNNREWFNERQRLKRKADPIAAHEYQKKCYQRQKEINGDKHSLRKVLSKRRITEEQYFAMLSVQDNKCAICFQPETRKQPWNKEAICRLTIDHCHETNEVRELLCHACNVFIGSARESIDVLKSAISYLEKHK
jgi:hypothetical protein